MTVGQRIRIARKEAGMTQEELASKMYVTHHCISMWERGLRQPKYETLSRITDAIGINVNRLLQTPMTNADRIRAMTDEELAEMLSPYMCPYNGEDYTRLGGVLKWLQQPAKEDA
jgi:transcriptional regulator with XRE-family HTH domain